VLLLLVSSVAFPQGGFRKKYLFPNSLNGVCSNVFEASSGNFIMTGFTQDTVNSQALDRLTVASTDPQGNLLWKKSYGSTNLHYVDNILAPRGTVIKDQNAFYQALVAKDGAGKFVSVLIKFNYNGDTLWQRKFYSNENNVNLYFQGIAKSVDGGILITGIFEDLSLPQRQCLVMKTDINGNELWRKKISKTLPNINTGNSIVQDVISKKIVVVGYQYIGANSDPCSNVMILDSLGTKLLQTSFNNLGATSFIDVIQLKDNNFLTYGNWFINKVGFASYYKAMAVKFDSAGFVIWSRLYDGISEDNAVTYARELPSQDIIIIGRADTSYGFHPTIKPQIMKTDKNGIMQWKREIGSAYVGPNNNYNYNTEYPRALNPTSDGGFIIPTWFPYASNTGHPYSIIKVDSLGCDTTEAYCATVEVGVSDFQKITGYGFSLFPNPANEFINFKITAPADKQFVLKISDVSGREIERVNANANIELQVNTSQYNPGVYFVSLFCEGRPLETKRLLIFK
jgi:hypothetical protein